eukprot:403372945
MSKGVILSIFIIFKFRPGAEPFPDKTQLAIYISHILPKISILELMSKYVKHQSLGFSRQRERVTEIHEMTWNQANPLNLGS